MPNTDLMDRVLALITAVPELHSPAHFSHFLGDWKSAGARERVLGLDEPLVVGEARFGTAHCFGGWALILGGYRYEAGGRLGGFYERDGQSGKVDVLATAARLLGIPVREALNQADRRGLFWGDNTLPQIRAWVTYYHGLITEDELDRLLSEESNA